MSARPLLFAACCVLCLGGRAAAALDPETKKPYQLTVVLHVADNRLLTDAFRERVERELREGLQAALGELGDVKVVREHPKLAEVLDKGLRSLDTWNERSGAKTHFVLIDVSGTDYEIEARQYDGLTGTATPLVRRDRTQDREFVGRAAVQMVERDLGVVATFQAWPRGAKPQKVQLELKGGGLDAPLNRWVQKGDVFAVVQIPTGSGTGRVVPDAIVQVEAPPGEREATCTGNLFWRRNPPGSAGVAGYRCVKLGAARGPLQVRLVQVDPNTGKPGVLPSPAPTLLVGRRGFTGEGDAPLEVTTDPKAYGSYDTTKLGDKGRFDRVAFVNVKLGADVRAQIPIVLLDDQPVTIPVTLAENDAPLADFDKRSFQRSVLQSYAEQSMAFTELSAKKDTPRAKLIEMAREAAKRSEEDLARLRAERDEVYGKNLTDADQRDRAQADQRLKAIETGVGELNRYIGRQEQIDTQEKDPKNQRVLEQLERGKLLEKEGELGKAIALYESILQDGFKSEELEQRVKKLRELWEPKSPEHRKARDFIYNTWPTLDTAGLQAQMGEARNALSVCRQVGDVVGPQKLYKGIQVHAARLLKESESLSNVNEEDAKQLKVIKDLGAELARLETEVKAFLDKPPK
jgi:hypothetical protein